VQDTLNGFHNHLVATGKSADIIAAYTGDRMPVHSASAVPRCASLRARFPHKPTSASDWPPERHPVATLREHHPGLDLAHWGEVVGRPSVGLAVWPEAKLQA
jgi:hypothetical protein